MTERINEAPCLGATAVMFPRVPESEDFDTPEEYVDDVLRYESDITTARSVCVGCPAPVFNACLLQGWREPDAGGVWAGMTDDERRRARKRKYQPEMFFRSDEEAS